MVEKRVRMGKKRLRMAERKVRMAEKRIKMTEKKLRMTTPSVTLRALARRVSSFFRHSEGLILFCHPDPELKRRGRVLSLKLLILKGL